MESWVLTLLNWHPLLHLQKILVDEKLEDFKILNNLIQSETDTYTGLCWPTQGFNIAFYSKQLRISAL